MTAGRDGFKPIEDYGAIGNLRTVALIARDGSIDWLCLPYMDSSSVFGAILDNDRGGFFRVAPAGAGPGEQRYIEDTNVLETVFDTPGGRLTVTDFMPLSGDINGCGDSAAPPIVFRILRCEGTAVDVEVLWSPRFDYGRARTRIDPTERGVIAHGGGQHLILSGIRDWDSRVVDDRSGVLFRARHRLEAGSVCPLVMRWGEFPDRDDADGALDALEQTKGVWRDWAHKEQATGDRSWAEPWQKQVIRSELALKLLTFADTGAIAAAPTTSLPETIGGVRNWDYRYTWIRDAGMTGQAFLSMGHDAEMRDFVHWAERVSESRAESERGIQIMYGLRGESDLGQEELEHLSGYRNSKPVHIGNDAVYQVQPDILGELVSAARQLVARGHELPEDIRRFIPSVADKACGAWKEPDHGLWEMPLQPRHYLYSKLMVWVALDRAVMLADQGVIEGDCDRWQRSRDEVRDLILRDGYNSDVGAFVQHFDSSDLDASNLMIPIEGLLPGDDERVLNTIKRTKEHLMENGLVYRYKVDDGLPGKEGAFVICTTWLIDALALSGQVDEAEEMLHRLAGRMNHVGLLSEQIDPHTGEFLGNFPQAFSHIGFINSALYVAHARGRDVPVLTPPA
jgi:GH15 family glucan-1,4-alpha-glucosidase